MTGEQQYDLPEGWHQERIGKVVLKAKQRDPRRAPDTAFKYVDVSGVSNESFRITEATTLKGKDAPSRARKEIRSDDVLFATVRPTLKRVAMVPDELDGQIASTGYCVLRSDKSKVEPRYLYAHLLTDDFIARMGRLERGAGYPAVRESDVFASPLPLPTLPEQQRIAQVLGTVQEAINHQERLIRTTTELKQALMQKLFTEGLRGEALKETENGLVPESWEVVQLQELADVKSGKRLPKGNALVAEDTGYPYIRVTDFDDNSVLRDQLLFVPTEIQPRIQRYIIEKNDVYISVAGSIGIVGMIPEELDGANLTENANRLVITNRKRIEPRYLMYWLDSERCQHEIKAQTLKNAQPKLGLGRIKTLGVALPSLDEQNAIVRALDAVRSKRQVAEQKTKTLQDLFRALLHELMTGKVRVSLDRLSTTSAAN